MAERVINRQRVYGKDQPTLKANPPLLDIVLYLTEIQRRKSNVEIGEHCLYPRHRHVVNQVIKTLPYLFILCLFGMIGLMMFFVANF